MVFLEINKAKVNLHVSWRNRRRYGVQKFRTPDLSQIRMSRYMPNFRSWILKKVYCQKAISVIFFSWLRRGQSHPVYGCRIKTGLSFDVSGFLTANRMVRSKR
jgi:hypothetical protein